MHGAHSHCALTVRMNLYTSTSQHPEFIPKELPPARDYIVHGNVDHRKYGSDATATRNQSVVDALSEILKRAVGRSDKEYAELPWTIIPPLCLRG